MRYSVPYDTQFPVILSSLRYSVPYDTQFPTILSSLRYSIPYDTQFLTQFLTILGSLRYSVPYDTQFLTQFLTILGSLRYAEINTKIAVPKMFLKSSTPVEKINLVLATDSEKIDDKFKCCIFCFNCYLFIFTCNLFHSLISFTLCFSRFCIFRDFSFFRVFCVHFFRFKKEKEFSWNTCGKSCAAGSQNVAKLQ